MFPRPAFRDVVSALKANDQSMLVANGEIREVPGASELEIQLIYIARRHSSHPWLVVGRTVVCQLNTIAIHAVERPRAKQYAGKALQLDDSSAEAHTSLGFIRLYYDWDFADAESEFKRAIQL